MVHKDKTEEIIHWKSILKRDSSSDEQVSLSSASRLHVRQGFSPKFESI